MSTKLIGWLLTILGLLIITYALYSSFGIFTAQEEPPSLFQAPQEINISETSSNTAPSEIARQEMEKIIKEQLNSMLPEKGFTKILNLISWSILAGILIFGGSKISSLGIKLLKK